MRFTKMRLRAYSPLEKHEPLDTGTHRVEVYELLVDGDVWYTLARQFELHGFPKLPAGVAVIDSETGMIRLRLASITEEE